MNSLEILPIPAIKDNYIWLLRAVNGHQVAVVDPGDASPVLTYLRKNDLHLSYILVTHHHYDHIDGIEALLREFPATPVFGPANESIKWLTIKLAEGEQIDLPDLKCSLSVLEVPGHTAGHIAYYGQDTDNPVLFCGDTLFAAGCGRLFDGTAEQLHASLCRLSKLPGNTRVYCTHEYTLNNLRFAKCVEPGNAEIVAREKKVIQQRQHNLPSLPSTIADELLSNPFLRVDQAEVKNSVTEFAKCNLESSLEVFSNLRRWKDRF